MEKVVRGEGDGEVWLVEGWRGIQRGGKGALVALMWTFEAVLAKQKQRLGTLLLGGSILSGCGITIQHRYYYYHWNVILICSHANILGKLLSTKLRIRLRYACMLQHPSILPMPLIRYS